MVVGLGVVGHKDERKAAATGQWVVGYCERVEEGVEDPGGCGGRDDGVELEAKSESAARAFGGRFDETFDVGSQNFPSFAATDESADTFSQMMNWVVIWTLKTRIKRAEHRTARSGSMMNRVALHTSFDLPAWLNAISTGCDPTTILLARKTRFLSALSSTLFLAISVNKLKSFR